MSHARPDPKMVAGRVAARLAVVQALYQMELAGASAERVHRDVQEGRLPGFEDAEADGQIDLELFRGVVDAVVEQQEALDTILARRLASGWRLERLDAVARAILRAGVAELWKRQDLPKPVIINAYVDIAKAFFHGPEAGFVNATLDACALEVRPADAP